MKTPSNHLFELVKSLDLSEKRYCTLYLQKHTHAAGNRYTLLFNALKDATTYHSPTAMAACGLSKKPNHYAVLKNQLYEQLLDALHQYDLFSNPEQQLQRGLHQCSLLVQKGLFNQCEKQMGRLQKMAADMHHYEAQLQLQNLRMVLKARKYYRNETEEDLKAWQQQTESIIRNMEVTNTYRFYSSVAYSMQYKAGVRGKDLARRMQPVINLPLFRQQEKAVTIRARLDYLQVNALYHFTNLETAEAAVYNQKFLALLEANPLLMQLNADRYFSVLNNYLIDCLVLKKFGLLEEGLQKLRNLHRIRAFKRLANFEANVFRLGYLLEMNYMITTGRFDQARQNIPAITKGLQRYGDRIVKHNYITLLYLSAYTNFALGRYGETLDSLIPVLQEKEMAVAEELQLAARMLQLLTHFELGDALLIESLAKSMQRLLLKKDNSVDMQRVVVAFIKKAGHSTNSELKTWQELKNKIVRLAKNQKTAAALNLFNYGVWCQGHITGQSFQQVWQTGNGAEKN